MSQPSDSGSYSSYWTSSDDSAGEYESSATDSSTGSSYEQSDDSSGEAFYDTIRALARAGTYLLVGADRKQTDAFYHKYCDPCNTTIRLIASTDDVTIGMTVCNTIAVAVEHESTCSVHFSLDTDQLNTPFVNYIVQETQASCFFDVPGSLQEFYEAFDSLESIDALIIFPSARIDTFPMLPASALVCINRMTQNDVVIVPGESNFPIPELGKTSLMRNALC